MNAQRVVERAVKENPEITVVLEIARRAREIEERRPMPESPMPTNLGVNPATSQAIVSLGHVLNDD